MANNNIEGIDYEEKEGMVTYMKVNYEIFGSDENGRKQKRSSMKHDTKKNHEKISCRCKSLVNEF
ncbi:hypothetical protein [Candidatus Stoquefichus massiliensis]|uniref:hypothetical protein n=1 Tax=Candidatus Stoquefichus massiliensis TaxID=1470350 RepID=UPI0004817EF1|nr:hypothetical protein [Candidatus Stoquefichus massiliensis]